VAGTGDLDRAGHLASNAETITRSLTDPNRQADALTTVVQAVADTGDLDWAETIARSFTDPNRQAIALAVVVRAVAGTGDLDRRAVGQQRRDDRPQYHRVVPASDCAGRRRPAVADTGDLDRAETIARSITDLIQQATRWPSSSERWSPPVISIGPRRSPAASQSRPSKRGR